MVMIDRPHPFTGTDRFWDMLPLNDLWNPKSDFDQQSAEEIMTICRASESQPGANGTLKNFEQLFGFFGAKIENDSSLVEQYK